MQSDNEDLQLPFDISDLAPSERGWKLEEIVACQECLRPNAPTRTSCLYCGLPLPILDTKIVRKPSLRPLEQWEKGFSVVLMPSDREIEDETINELSSLLRLEALSFKNIVGAKEPLPVACVASLEEAKLIEDILRKSDLEARIFSDYDLSTDSLPKRIKRVEFKDQAIVVWSIGEENITIPTSSLICMVEGTILTNSTELTESRKRGKESQIVNKLEIGTDEAVLDIYSIQLDTNLRISMKSFDYSSLGERKGLVVAENFKILLRLLCEHAPHATYKSSYKKVKNLLRLAWPMYQSSSAVGVKREKALFASRTLMVSNNELQFTRYSRMQYLIEVNNRDLTTSV
jgi:hypothetical protein